MLLTSLRAGPSLALSLLAFGSVLSGCKGDRCASEPPSFQLDLSAASAEARAAGSLLVSVVGAEIRARRTYDLSGELSDGATALVVVLDPPPASTIEVELEVVAFAGAGGGGAEVGRGTGRFSLTADACNQLSLALGAAAPEDGGVPDAPSPDLGLDLGLADVGDAGALDLGVDTGLPDADLSDVDVPDVDAPDLGEPDLGEPDAGFEPVVYPYVPSNFDPSILSARVPGVFDCGLTQFDTTTLVFTNWCGAAEPTPLFVSQTGAPEAVLLTFEGLSIAAASSLRVVGTHPLILAVVGAASIGGTIDLGARGITAGPGGSFAGACTPGTGGTGGFNAGAGAGGGGGGFGLAGGRGGDNANNAAGGAAGAVSGVEELEPLRGGCSGGPGAATGRGLGGAGGGAIQISATEALDVSGQILVGGGGGEAGGTRAGGGGGGSGGALVLEGTSVTVAGLLVAKGGGGGGGGDDSSGAGEAGGDAAADEGVGGAGGGGGGRGGSGSTGPSPGEPGAEGQNGRDAGGGGGGGPGRIRINATGLCTLTGTVAPSATGCP